MCTELSLIDARGVCTAYLGSSRDLPKIKEKNPGFVLATFDPGHVIWLKTCDPQFGLLCLDVTFPCQQGSWDSKGDNWGPKVDCARVLPMVNTNYTSPITVREGMAAIVQARMNFKRVFLANVESQGDKSASQIIKKLIISFCLIAWCYGACAELRKKCYPVYSEDYQEFDAPEVEDKFEEECEMSPHYDAHHTTVWEDYTLPEVMSLECSCHTCDEDQLGSVEMPHVCLNLLTVEEGDTITTNYFTVSLDKLC